MSVTLSELALFAAAFCVAVASPGPFAAAVTARSMAHGFRSGGAMAVGSIVGDYLFAILAMTGLAALALWMGWVIVGLKYIGAAWLIWLGVRLLRAPAMPLEADPADAPRRDSPRRAFLAGALVGVGNPKAALFYLAVFPGFFDIAHLTFGDALAILAVIGPIVVGGNLIWAALGAKAGRAVRSAHAIRRLNRISGAVLTGAGAAVAAS